MSDLCFFSARELAASIRRGELSAREVIEAHLAQIVRVNPKVNAIVTLVAERALESARQADEAQARGPKQGEALGPLHGLPVAHKDLFETAGVRTTFGSRIFKDHVPDRDAIIVERAKRAGAIMIGKTNTPEFGAGSQTFNEVFGATPNPYDLTKTCGGSSGGSAVALACGMVPLADGSDHASSLRNPAAFCGVVGLRPAPGRVPAAPASNPWSTLSVDGPMARNVGDIALYLSAIAGPDPRSPISISQPGSHFAGCLDRHFKGTRVAWFKDLGGVPFDRRILEIVNAQRTLFESLGCIVEEAEPDWTGATESYNVMRALGYVGAHSENVRLHRDLIKDTILWQVEQGRKLSADEIARATTLRAQLWERVRVFLGRYEFFVLPTTQALPFDIRQPYVMEIEGVKMASYIEWMKSCYYITIVETPAISLPCGFTPEGLPVGLQIVGRHRDEWGLLQMAHAFEQAANVGIGKPPV
ncbi:MAG TPA: amidase [Bryobacteraceae bacterium]|nr:amidase [Bryobacteraceae bacterium]